VGAGDGEGGAGAGGTAVTDESKKTCKNL
jgi:hypothetical protein